VPLMADVTQEETLAAAMTAAEARWGRIDILHNNVGVSIAGGDKPLDELTEEAFDRVCAINLRGTIMACKHVLPIMRRQRSGAIINISSVAARENSYPLVAYKATKAAMIAFTEQLALQNASYGIRANCILPGLMDSRQQPQPRRGRSRARRQSAVARPNGNCVGCRQRRALPRFGRGQFHHRRGASRRWRRACAGRMSVRSSWQRARAFTA
jgi:NAD(P)-dependent dehydrogenase (short-subunit alcohol dehydrogenase family)